MNNSYKKELYRIFFKKELRNIPKVFVIILLVGVICAGIVFGVTKLYGEDATKIKIAYVYEEEELWFEVGLKNMGRSVNCEFKKYDEDDAMEALEDNEVAAVIVVNDDPDEEFNSNFPISSLRFIHYDTDDFINSAFDDIVTSALKDFMVLNLTRNAIKLTYSDYDRSQIYDLEDELLEYLMHRNRYYEMVEFYDSGDIPLKSFYLGNVYVLITLLSAAVIIGFSKNDDFKFIIFAKRNGISGSNIFVAKYLPIISFYTLLTVLITIIYQISTFGNILFLGLVSALLGTYISLAIIILLHELIGDKTISVLSCLVFSIVAMYLSGNIIPTVFLPESISGISKYVVTAYPSKLLGQMFYGQYHLRTILIGLVILIAAVAFSLIISAIKGRKEVNV